MLHQTLFGQDRTYLRYTHTSSSQQQSGRAKAPLQALQGNESIVIIAGEGRMVRAVLVVR